MSDSGQSTSGAWWKLPPLHRWGKLQKNEDRVVLVLALVKYLGARPWAAEWEGKPEARQAVHGNRRRIRGEHGKELLRRRGELLERSFAHAYETGGMRRVHLRGREDFSVAMSNKIK